MDTQSVLLSAPFIVAQLGLGLWAAWARRQAVAAAAEDFAQLADSPSTANPFTAVGADLKEAFAANTVQVQGKVHRTQSTHKLLPAQDAEPGATWAESVPALLTWVGMLGTFIGVALALSDFETSDPDRLQDEVQQLLSPLGAAFLTSITGLVGALFSRGFLLFQRRRFESDLRLAIDTIDATRPRVSESELLLDRLLGPATGEALIPKMLGTLDAVGTNIHTIAERKDPATLIAAMEQRVSEQVTALQSQLTDQKGVLDKMDNTLAKAVEDAILGVVNDNDKNGNNGLFKRIEAIGSQLAQGNTDSTQAMADQLAKSLDDRLGTRLDGFGDSVDKVVQANNAWDGKLDNLGVQLTAATTQLQAASGALTTAGSGLHTTAKALADTFEQADTTFSTLDSALRDIQGELANLQGTLSTTRDGWETERKTWHDTTAELADLKEAVHGVSQLWGAWEDALDKQQALTNASANDRAQGAQLLEQIRTASSGFATVAAQMHTLSSTLKTDLDTISAQRDAGDKAIEEKLERLGKLGEATRSLFDGYQTTFTDLAEHMPDIQQALGTVDDLTKRQQDAIEAARQLADRLDTAAKQVRTLGDVLDPLQAAATTLAPTAERLEASSTHLATVLETSQSSLSSNQEATRALLSASTTIRTNAEKAAKAWTESASALQTTRDDFTAAHTSLTAAAREFGTTVESVVKRLGDEQDAQLSSALGKLKDAVGSLNSVANTLSESIFPLAEALDSSSQRRRK